MDGLKRLKKMGAGYTSTIHIFVTGMGWVKIGGRPLE